MLKMDSFRNRLMVLFAGLAFTLGLCITLYIGKTASAQMSKSSGQTLYIAAKSISNTLANSLTEREREMVLLSQSPFIAEGKVGTAGSHCGCPAAAGRDAAARWRWYHTPAFAGRA